MFDRQTEVAQNVFHPGTKVDYDYFDLVVRGVIPAANSTPDNGVMMVNPRNITVVFGPELQVTGKPYNASVSFDKFSHKMIVTRTRIALQMKVFQVGPRPLAYTYETAQVQREFAATVPYDLGVTVTETNKSISADKAAQAGADPSGWAALGLSLGSTNTGGAVGAGSGSGGGSTFTGPVDPSQTKPKTMSYTKFSQDVLTTLGVSNSGENLVAMVTWCNAEGGSKGGSNGLYNPLNTGLSMPGSTTYGNQGGQVAYASYTDGVTATARTIQEPFCAAFLRDFQANAPAETTLLDIQNSAWAGGHYLNQGGLVHQAANGRNLVGKI